MEPAVRLPLADLLERLARSPEDQHAWTALYHLMWPFVFAINYRILRGRRELAEDLSQDVFLRLKRYCPFERLTSTEGFKAYVSAVCRNTCRSVLRAARVHELSLDEICDPDTLEPPAAFDLAQQVEADDLLRDLFGRLGLEDRNLLRLILQGYGVGEIAARSGLGYSAAGVRVFRLRRKLAGILGRKNPGSL
jgi:RNA polymerase sigma factor (sigma-70 family)